MTITTQALAILQQPGVRLAALRWLVPDEFGAMHEGEHDDALELLHAHGLVDDDTSDDTELGREVARLLTETKA